MMAWEDDLEANWNVWQRKVGQVKVEFKAVCHVHKESTGVMKGIYTPTPNANPDDEDIPSDGDESVTFVKLTSATPHVFPGSKSVIADFDDRFVYQWNGAGNFAVVWGNPNKEYFVVIDNEGNDSFWIKRN